MGVLWFLIAIVLLVAIIYVTIIYFSRKQTKVIEELTIKKEKLMAVPIEDSLFTLKNLHLTGQTKRMYESWNATWQTINRFRFPEIEASLVSAEQYNQKVNFVKSSQMTNQVNQLIDETKTEVDKIFSALQKLIESEKVNREKLESLQERYSLMRKDLLAHSFSFGDALETLEKRLAYLELDFTKFNTLTNEGDHLEAKEILNRIEMEMGDFEQIVQEVPQLLKEIQEEQEDQVKELKEGYEKLKADQFQFAKIQIPDEIDKIEGTIKIAKEHIAATELEEARVQIDKASREIDHLYEVMEGEIDAKVYVTRNKSLVEKRLSQVQQNNKYAIIEVDRLSQDYILSNNEFTQIHKMEEDLAKEQEAILYYAKSLENHQVPFSLVQDYYQMVFDKLNTIDREQTDLVTSIQGLRTSEKAVRENLDNFEMDLRNMKRTVENYHLPGLPKSYLDLFFTTGHRIEQLSEKLNRIKIDMKEIDQLNQMIEQDVESLDILTEQLIDQAQLTEYMIQHANRYRLTNQSIEIAIQESLEFFQGSYQFGQALEVIETALNQVEPGAGQRVREIYQAEKSNQLF